MLVVMQAHATDEQVRAVCRKIESLGYRAHPMPGAQRTAVCVTGNRGEVEAGTLEEMAGVQELIRVSKPYKLVGGPGWRSSPGRAPLRAASRRLLPPTACPAPERSSFAAERISRAPRHIHFKA